MWIGKVVIYSVDNGVGEIELVLQYAQLCLKQEFYPGGIFLSDARDENIGSQIIKFGKNKLNLKFLDGLDIQQQVSDCWSYWPSQGDVLLILDNIRDYQQVKIYLPPYEKRFKVIVITKELYGQSWLNASFELFLLNGLPQEHKDEQGEFDIENDILILLGIGFCLQLFSTISLIASYIWCNSYPWKHTFQTYGWVIEFIRSCILFF